MTYESQRVTANKLGLSANSNFARIVDGLNKLAQQQNDEDCRLMLDAIRLLQQQNAEIRDHYRMDQY